MKTRTSKRAAREESIIQNSTNIYLNERFNLSYEEITDMDISEFRQFYFALRRERMRINNYGPNNTMRMVRAIQDFHETEFKEQEIAQAVLDAQREGRCGKKLKQIKAFLAERELEKFRQLETPNILIPRRR